MEQGVGLEPTTFDLDVSVDALPLSYPCDVVAPISDRKRTEEAPLGFMWNTEPPPLRETVPDHLTRCSFFRQGGVAVCARNQYTIGTMSIIRFMLILAFATLLSWAAWILVVVRLNPYSDGLTALVLFFGSAAVAVAGTLTILGFFVRYWLEKGQVLYRQFAVASRQAIIVTAGCLVIGVLQLQHILRPWSALLVLLIAVIIELFIQAGSYRRTVHPQEVLPT